MITIKDEEDENNFKLTIEERIAIREFKEKDKNWRIPVDIFILISIQIILSFQKQN